MNEATEHTRRVLLVCQRDGYANGVLPNAIERFMRERGHDVQVADTYSLSRASSDRSSVRSKLPALEPKRLALYGVEAASRILMRRWGFGRRKLTYYYLLGDYKLRRLILRSMLPLDDFDAVVCVHPHDAGIVTVPTSARMFYDCPTPWADEMLYEGRLTPRQHRRLRELETGLYQRADALSFSWESYGRYVVEHYGVDAGNFRQLNWGCTPAERRAEFRDPLRVAYIGSLSSRFIDLPLLSRLSKLYPHIDVYGGPPPDPALGLNYRGWAPPDVLEGYQLGLITCTQDELRSQGFSAKHLDYIAYGLPTLVPAWRRHLDLIEGSVPYTEDTFVSVIEGLRDPAAWQRASDEAYAQAQRLTWDRTLEPLDAFLRETAPQARPALAA